MHKLDIKYIFFTKCSFVEQDCFVFSNKHFLISAPSY